MNLFTCTKGATARLVRALQLLAFARGLDVPGVGGGITFDVLGRLAAAAKPPSPRVVGRVLCEMGAGWAVAVRVRTVQATSPGRHCLHRR